MKYRVHYFHREHFYRHGGGTPCLFLNTHCAYIKSGILLETCRANIGPSLPVSCFLPLVLVGSCADIMHSAQPFQNGFKEPVIAIILRDVVRGLDYLHNLGYIHRWVRLTSMSGWGWLVYVCMYMFLLARARCLIMLSIHFIQCASK